MLCRLFVFALIATPAFGGEADVMGVKVTQDAGGSYSFTVTVRHADTGWDHYADRWEVLGSDGAVYGTRVLLHPHETEQPFTRSETGITIPQGMSVVTVRAHDLRHGYGGAELTVELPGR